jgi:FixJ family two-component response regulator
MHHKPAGQKGVQKTSVISIVDDDESVRFAMENLLRSLGHVVHTFASAQDFLQSPCVDETASVIADIQMPGMTGLEMQGVLLRRGYALPIIFITAFPDERIQERALNAGALCVLSKPFNASAMIECLERALQGSTRPGKA